VAARKGKKEMPFIIFSTLIQIIAWSFLAVKVFRRKLEISFRGQKISSMNIKNIEDDVHNNLLLLIQAIPTKGDYFYEYTCDIVDRQGGIFNEFLKKKKDTKSYSDTTAYEEYHEALLSLQKELRDSVEKLKYNFATKITLGVRKIVSRKRDTRPHARAHRRASRPKFARSAGSGDDSGDSDQPDPPGPFHSVTSPSLNSQIILYSSHHPRHCPGSWRVSEGGRVA
jgi:hypothetical protein